MIFYGLLVALFVFVLLLLLFRWYRVQLYRRKTFRSGFTMKTPEVAVETTVALPQQDSLLSFEKEFDDIDDLDTD